MKPTTISFPYKLNLKQLLKLAKVMKVLLIISVLKYCLRGILRKNMYLLEKQTNLIVMKHERTNLKVQQTLKVKNRE